MLSDLLEYHDASKEEILMALEGLISNRDLEVRRRVYNMRRIYLGYLDLERQKREQQQGMEEEQLEPIME